MNNVTYEGITFLDLSSFSQEEFILGAY